MNINLDHLVDRIRVPAGGDKVYNDQCVYSFDTPRSPGGLYVCMKTFLGLGRDYVELHARKTHNTIFLHIKSTKKPPQAKVGGKVEEEPPQKKPTRLAIGVEGGFDGGVVEKVEYEDHTSIVILPEYQTIPLPSPDLPQKFQDSAAGILAANPASKVEAIAVWDGEQRKVSKHAEGLVQLDNGRKIPPTGWKCEKCDLTKNLWLNLSDGSILCGRKYFDGSGGNNHAVEHYESAKHPLAVKLGTITADGAGDVYSYDEDDMVLDPHLGRHLAHWGINVASMTKTDSTMTELEIDMNMRIGEWSILQESNENLVPVFGPGYTGLKNLGNSCYFNSVFQVLFIVPDFQRRYFDKASAVFETSQGNPPENLGVQMSKMAVGLLSGKYSQPPEEDDPATVKGVEPEEIMEVSEGEKTVVAEGEESERKPVLVPEGVSPYMLKSLVGRGHPEFGTVHQQDSCEYFLHLLDFIDRKERAEPGSVNPTECFKFQLEECVRCVKSGMVRYSLSEGRVLRLPVAMDAATNLAAHLEWEKKKAEKQSKKERIDPSEEVRLEVPFQACLKELFSPATIPDFYSTALKASSEATKTTRLASFPDYLMVQVNKFTVAEDWTPKKLDVVLDVPNELDLTPYRGQGLQPGEVELPEEEEPQPVEVVIDEGLVVQLVDMGFPMEGCRRAVYHTRNQGIEPAMEWVLQHMGDQDFADPFVPPSSSAGRPKPGGSGPSPSEEDVSMLLAMGFSREQALKGLQQTNGNLERAADWLFSHADELDAMDVGSEGDQVAVGGTKFRDGSGKYELVAFISHMGTSTSCGHYVCHICKDGRWVIFNDEKVAESKSPPVTMGYLYLYKRRE